MRYRLSKGFSLLEVLITAAILSSAIIFIFQAFAACLASARFSQNISRACYLSENQIWQIRQRQLNSTEPLAAEEASEAGFRWQAETQPLPERKLLRLDFKVSWKEQVRQGDYEIDFLTYLATAE